MTDRSKILIVDDEIRMLDSLEKLLSKQNCEIHTSNGGAEAIDRLINDSFDLVILDVVMPEIDGFNVLDHIKDRNENTEVILMTGHSTVDSAIAALRKGAYDFIKKPFEYEELLKTIENALHHAAVEKENIQVKEALIESEERYRSLIELSPDGICVSSDGKIIFVNQAMIDIWGAGSEDDLLGRTVFDMIHPDYREKSRKRYQMMTEEMNEAPLRDFIFLRLDNSDIHVQAKSTHVNFKGLSAVLTAVRDISELKKAEADKVKLETQLHHAQRMESLGTLAGGIAHDFNNLLMGIQGRTSLMLLETDTHHPHFEHLKGLEEYIKSASDLTKQLLAFARGGKYEVIPTDLNEIIRKGSEMFGRTKKEITISINSQENIWTVEVDRSQIEQIMLNLYVNAWQSMPGGGRIIS